jgi:hypothetical protein
MADFPQFEYSMGDVRRAGEALGGNLIWTDETAELLTRVGTWASAISISLASWMCSTPTAAGFFRWNAITHLRQRTGIQAGQLRFVPKVMWNHRGMFLFYLLAGQ